PSPFCGQLMRRLTDTIGAATDKLRKVLQQHFGSAKISRHVLGVIKGSPTAQQAKPIKTRENPNDTRRMLPYKAPRSSVHRGRMFFFPTDLLPDRRFSVYGCGYAALGKLVKFVSSRCFQAPTWSGKVATRAGNGTSSSHWGSSNFTTSCTSRSLWV